MRKYPQIDWFFFTDTDTSVIFPFRDIALTMNKFHVRTNHFVFQWDELGDTRNIYAGNILFQNTFQTWKFFQTWGKALDRGLCPLETKNASTYFEQDCLNSIINERPELFMPYASQAVLMNWKSGLVRHYFGGTGKIAYMKWCEVEQAFDKMDGNWTNERIQEVLIEIKRRRSMYMRKYTPS